MANFRIRGNSPLFAGRLEVFVVDDGPPTDPKVVHLDMKTPQGALSFRMTLEEWGYVCSEITKKVGLLRDSSRDSS